MDGMKTIDMTKNWCRIDNDRLPKVWANVRFGLLEIIRKTGERWLPEDVYLDLKLNKSVLWYNDASFLVLQRDGDEMHIFAAYNANGLDFGSQFAWLKEHAIGYGFKRLTVTSPRKGWAKYFKPVSINYEAEL